MSDKQPAPLYSDEAIVGFYQNAFNDEPSAALMRFIGMIRDDYEEIIACQTSPSEDATIARLTQANAELAAEVARLKAQGNRQNSSSIRRQSA